MEKRIEHQIARRYPGCRLVRLDVCGDTVAVHLASNVKEGICPVCGELTHSLHRRYIKRFTDLPIEGRFCVVFLTLGTLTCRSAVCARATFFPAPHAFLPDPYAKKTDRLVKRILEVACAKTVRGSVEALVREGIKCDKNTISRLLEANALRKRDIKR